MLDVEEMVSNINSKKYDVNMQTYAIKILKSRIPKKNGRHMEHDR